MTCTLHFAKTIVPGYGPRIDDGILLEKDGYIVLVTRPEDPALREYLRDPAVTQVHHGASTLIPGFLDIHTHGALGHDFIDPDLEKLGKVAKFYAGEGTTSFLTSLMAKPRPIERDLLETYGKMDAPEEGARWIGIHNEGPFLSLKFKAMMEAEGIRKIVKGEIDDDVQLTRNKLRMVTVAPESDGIEVFIEECHHHQVAVMFAHTDATAQQTLHALAAGGDGFTHLYNAMTQHTHRSPGAVTAALLKGDSYCELITDGFHIDPLVVKLTYQILGSRRLICITDANPAKGMGDGEFIFGGVECVNVGRKALTKATGRIAGSTIGMIDAFKNILEFTGCSIEEAVEMTSVNPAKLLKLEKIGGLKPGKCADFTILDDHYDVVATYREGKRVFQRETDKKLYKILPVFNYRIWGGNRLKEKYGYVSDLPNIGECYNVIAMKGHLDCTVEATGQKLSDFYLAHPDLFKSDTDEMPVRTAMANPIIPMSIQLHPDDAYAMKHEGKKGKPDGVYFIEGEGTMVLGHTAQTYEEFKAKVDAKAFDALVRVIPVRSGDFVDVPYGTLHAFGGGVTLIEFTQNADLTYRLYDYDRIDPITKNPRPLHVRQVLDNIRIPNDDTRPVALHPIEEEGIVHTVFHDEPGVYTAGKLEVEHEGYFQRDEFYFLTILDGNGKIDDQEFIAGETWFVPCESPRIKITGKCCIAYVTYQRKGKV